MTTVTHTESTSTVTTSPVTARATGSHLTSATRKAPRILASGLVAGAIVLTGSACSSSSQSTPAASPTKAAPKTVNLSLVGKIDADKGPAGTFTSKEHWPAMAPSDLTFAKGDTVVLTVKEYDDAPTALPAGSPYNKIAGGIMKVDGVATTTVPNADIAHTFSIPELGINLPLKKAPEGGATTTVFTFKVDKSGTYTWHCFTPCGGEPGGMGGSMATNGWMQGRINVT